MEIFYGHLMGTINEKPWETIQTTKWSINYYCCTLYKSKICLVFASDAGTSDMNVHMFCLSILLLLLVRCHIHASQGVVFPFQIQSSELYASCKEVWTLEITDKKKHACTYSMNTFCFNISNRLNYRLRDCISVISFH